MAISWRVVGGEEVEERESVSTARRMKFVPPARSVSLSNLNVKAMLKKMSWYAIVMRRVRVR